MSLPARLSRFAFMLRLILSALLLAATLSPPAAASPQGDDAFDEAMNKARLNLRQREYDDALKFFKRANAMKGNTCVECLWGMAQAYSKLGANKNVIETCDRLAAAAADDKLMSARAYNLKGITYADMAMQKMDKPDQKKLTDAETAFRKVLEINSTFEMAHYNLGVTLIRLGREADGIAELKEYVEGAPDENETAEQARKVIANPRRARENFAPDFSITTAEGEYITSDDLRGKVVLVDFWGTWCPPCVASIPSLVSLNKRFSKEPFVLISVSSDNDTAKWRTFIEQNKMTWPQFLDRTDKVQRAFSVNSFPTYVLIDHDGVIRHRSSGYDEYVEAMIAGAIKKALKVVKAAPPTAPAQPVQTAAPAATSTRSSPQPVAQSTAAMPPASSTAPAAAATPSPQPAESPAGPKLPTPVLEVMPPQIMEVGRHRMLRFPLRMKNWTALPDELFAEDKDLEPCGMGAVTNRAQVGIFSESGERLLNYCDVPSAEIFQNFWLVINPEQVPEKIYITVKDRHSGASVRSNIVALPPVTSAAQP